MTIGFATGIRRLSLLASVLTVAGAMVPSAIADAEQGEFRSAVAPVLEAKCLRCHSPGIAKGDLSLATAAGLLDGGYVVPGQPGDSHLLQVVRPDGNDGPRMPKDGDPLTPEEIAALSKWIADGAEWPADVVLREPSAADADWWSLQPLAEFDDSESPAARLDAFIDQALAAENLHRNPPADRRTLIRRASYDLLGLPPTPEEIDAFVNDPAPDAWPRLVDRLLASPHYGERWGRHWLDVVRFGESRGYERNEIINNIWPFRDYVIRSLNDDTPISTLIREHLAGDVIAPNQPDIEIGSAFLVAGPYDDVGNQDPVQAAQIRANTLDEIIRTTSEAFLGLTVGCARCHDHKFDPILQRDYYGLYATFAGVRHGSRVVATVEQQQERAAALTPLQERQTALEQERQALMAAVQERFPEVAAREEPRWVRPPADRTGTTEEFPPVETRFVRLVSEGQDITIANRHSFGIDEFEVWSAEPEPRNVALAANGAVATGPSRQIEDFPGAYGPELAIDGRYGARFLAVGGHLTIELPEPVRVNRVHFSSARTEAVPEHPKFAFVAEYRIEVSSDGQQWSVVADSHDRRPVNEAQRNQRMEQLAITPDESARRAELDRELQQVREQIAAIPPLPNLWVGTRSADDAAGPFHVFVGGSPQRPGETVQPSSLSVLDESTAAWQLPSDAPEGQRRLALADWIVSPDNPLTPRVVANRIWQHHFGTGIVHTPNDFGYMGGRPSHPELLDWLARQLLQHEWRLKPLHRLILLSDTWQQSGDWREEAAAVDSEARLLWRFPPRRLSAEEVRDTLLAVSGELDTTMGGPGFRLYEYLQDNVATYVPLDEFGPETYRRSVYHQNARASRVDLMTDFDQPDCAFSTATRAETTTPLQALTLLNHDFTVDLANAFADRIVQDVDSETDAAAQVRRAFRLCYGREPTADESAACQELIATAGLPALCRALLNTSELIYVK